MTIKRLFDPAKDIYRTIEKVITYNASQEARLRAEISEYIVTENIEEQFEKLLSRMQAAMGLGGGNEIGVWVSGFYGSGKSSFTKYLGLALDDQVAIDGEPFLTHFQNRLQTKPTRALLTALTTRYPAAVVLLDLASEMLAGATMEEVSTVLFYKVLQWAGYSKNLKVAALERRLRKDGRSQEFLDLIAQQLGMPWAAVKDDPLVVDSMMPAIAHMLYPNLFKTDRSFTTEASDFVVFEHDRVREMLDIVRDHTGKQYVLFIIDEVGQYVGARPHLILNLDGLAKNLKDIGDGKVWIIGTAQQTLTEDDQKAAINSPELYKLKDRFPIQIDLESSDIKEICYRRLLGKSPEGERQLSVLFDQHGQALRHNTKLQDARYYEADFDRASFVNLYPFLPAHFEILLRLLAALAKSTGGIGLRSAIKVIQDILVEGPAGRDPVADQPIGWLATTVTLYDSLEKDIRRAAPSIHKAVDKARERFHDSLIHQQVAKTVAVLQILANMPVTVQNITSLIHPAVNAPSRRDEVEAAISDLVGDAFVPFGEKDGNLCFFSERLNDIDQERLQIAIRTIETRRIQNDVLRDTVSPLPAARLEGAFAVTAGLKAQSGGQTYGLAGDNHTIQTVVELVDPADYETARARLVEESRARGAQYTIFLLGRSAPEIEDKVNEIYRCDQIAQRYRNDPDQEVRDYCLSQAERISRLRLEVGHLLRRLLTQGSFIFRGQVTAVETLNPDLLEAAKRHLGGVAEQVFDRYKEAPVRANTDLAEKFLKTENLRAVSSANDPLGLVQLSGGKPAIQTQHKALVSIRDYLNANGTVDGKRLTDVFTEAPYGWSPDTLRYLVAALLVGGEITLKISGNEVNVKGQKAIDALRTNQAFRAVGVALRDSRPSNEVLGRAADRLTQITGDTVIPLEDEISKAAARAFPTLQQRYGPLAEKLDALGLPGADNVRALVQELTDVLVTDASDAPQRIGGVTSALYERLRWAGEVDTALRNGLEATARELQRHRHELSVLPDSEKPNQLRDELSGVLSLTAQRLAGESFHTHAADLRGALTMIKSQIADTVVQLAASQGDLIRQLQQQLQQLPAWAELTQEEQSAALADLEQLELKAAGDVQGLRQMLNQEHTILGRSHALRQRIETLAAQRRAEREQPPVPPGGQGDGAAPVRLPRRIKVPAKITTVRALDQVIERLQQARSAMAYADDIDVLIELEGEHDV